MDTSPALNAALNHLVLAVQGLGDVVFRRGGWILLLWFAAGLALYVVVQRRTRQSKEDRAKEHD